MKKVFAQILGSLLIFAVGLSNCLAWDYDGHRVVNQLALASLPADFPAFVQTPSARERVAFLSGEPDRWRNVSDPVLKHFNGPDHYIDLEQLEDYGIDMHSLPHFRYNFTAQLALARAAHPDHFPPIDPERNGDQTRQLVGFLPWAIVENYDKLKSGFSYLKTYEQAGTPEEIANAQENILYIMGVMGHYVGDATQPLHTSKHHHGWVGDNPNHYTTNYQFHAWIDGGYFQKIGGLKFEELKGRIRPAQPVLMGNDAFAKVMDYIVIQYELVEPLYRLEKEGKLSGEGELGHEGKAFLERQVVAGGQMLGNIWYSAWKEAAPDNYLKSQLLLRKMSRNSAEAQKP